MRLARHVPWLVSSVKGKSTTIRLATCCSVRGYATESRDSGVKDIAVVGGGITGLTTAFYAKAAFPHANITVYEAESRVGGWLQSKCVEVKGGTILFEQGPRSLRAKTLNALATVSLIQDLGLISEVIGVPNQSPAAKNRYIYYPDHLVRLPTLDTGKLEILYTVLTEPLYQGLPLSAAREIAVPKRPDSLEDESIRSFFSRRFSPEVADNNVSAFVHGVYAGDTEKLSIKSIMPQLWHAEGKYGSIVKMVIDDGLTGFSLPETSGDTDFKTQMQDKVWKDDSLRRFIESSNIISLRRGLESLVIELRKRLIEKDVTIKEGVKVTGIDGNFYSENVQISTSSKIPIAPSSHVIFTIPPNQISEICRKKSTSVPMIPSISKIPSVTVMLVNLYFRNPSLLPVRGFGYLIPRSVPFNQNPEFALGVIFDSEQMTEQDTAPGTKVTVMLGGHWWNGWRAFPDESDAKAMAMSVLARHLGIAEEPECVNVALQKDCIPQYAVGHEAVLKGIQDETYTAFAGKVRMVGGAYTGVGVNDCIRSAFDIVKELQDSPSRGTGLERFI